VTPSDLSLVLVGPPGAGKGTQAKPLAAELDLVYVATGDLLRTAVAAGAPVGRDAKRYMDAGELVPDELIMGLLREELERDAPAGGFVLDGFPRTIDQAQALDAALERVGQPAPRAILIDVPDEVLIARLGGRRICAAQGHEYHLQFRPPARQGSCDLDGSPLIRRADDEPVTIRRRLAVYHRQTSPLITHFEVRGRLLRIGGDGELAEVRRRLAAAISRPTVA
jgi:adenylate kinase